MSPHPDERPTGIDQRLLRMRVQGFAFATDRDHMDMVVTLCAVRAHHGVIDIVELYGEDDALAMRIPGDEPDIMRPVTVLWRTSGSASETIDQVLDLPDPKPVPHVTTDPRVRTDGRYR